MCIRDRLAVSAGNRSTSRTGVCRGDEGCGIYRLPEAEEAEAVTGRERLRMGADGENRRGRWPVSYTHLGIYVSIGCRSNIQFVRLPVP